MKKFYALVREIALLAEAQNRHIYDSMPDGVIVVEQDGEVAFANAAAHRLLRLHPSKPVPSDWKAMCHAMLPDKVTPYPSWQMPTQLALLGKEVSNVEIFLSHGNGKDVWLNVNARPVRDSEGQVVGAVAVLRNITERKQADRLLEESRQHYKSLFEHNPNAVYSLDKTGHFVTCNDACARISGYSLEELKQISFVPLVHEDDLDEVLRHFHQAVAGDPQNFEARIWHKNGHIVHLAVTNIPIIIDSEVTGVHAIVQDITDRKQFEEQLTQMAQYDSLTGLPNRRLFYDRLDQAMERARRHQCHMALLFMDLNGFKVINDTYGHGVGDQLLIAFAARLRQSVRKMDTVARLAGDEFIVIVEDMKIPDAAIIVADKIGEATQQPFLVDQYVIQIALSIGIAVFENKDSADDLIKKADSAMYLSKISDQCYMLYVSSQ